MPRFVIFSLKISDAVIIWQLSDKTDLEWIISKVVNLVGLDRETADCEIRDH